MMNQLHQWLCSSRPWAGIVEKRYLPWALDGAELGKKVLEIGPDYGATTRVLARLDCSLTAVELDSR